MAKILILIGGHLYNGPRPVKEADALTAAGHQVTVAGIWFDPMFAERDRQILQQKSWRFQPALDFRPGGRDRLTSIGVRLQTKFVQQLFQRFQIAAPALLGYGTKALLRTALRKQADLTIVHSEAGLWVASQLLDRGFRVGVDFEDWFSQDLLPAAQATRPIALLKSLEARLAQNCAYCLTTSQAMAAAMAATYQIPPPTVIYNVFPFAERQGIDQQYRDRQNLQLCSLHWFSQTIGPGRGLEMLFQSLAYLTTPVEIHLRGNCPAHYRSWLEASIPENWRDRIFVHPTVPNAELLSRIAEHDIGLALESPEIPSRDLTVTNKLFQYLQGGLALIASETAGQREILSQYPATGQLIPPNSPIDLARAIESFSQNSDRLKAAKAAALQAIEPLCWEQEAEKLKQQANQALNVDPLAVLVKSRTPILEKLSKKIYNRSLELN